jgi:hypothetical protein
MNTLANLVGQKVFFYADGKKIECTVIGIDIDDSYFNEGEPIYIYANLQPLHENDVAEMDETINVLLSEIFKA